MGSYTFKWEHPSEDVSDVLVTGSFDNWTKSVKLEKVGGIFRKTVQFEDKDAANKIYYKFVVDNNWTINESYPHEADSEGNVNNFLKPTDLSQSGATPFINTVTPESTTVAMAGKKNKKSKANKQAQNPAVAAAAAATSADNSGSESSAAPVAAGAAPALDVSQPAGTATSTAVPKDIESKDGTATPSDVPGGFPVTPSNEVEDKTIGINPLPGTAGHSNPVKLAPGEKIPESITAQGVNDNVKLDKASYEKSDALPTSKTGSAAPTVGTIIPESSLAMGDQTDVNNPIINSAGNNTTTAALAGQVPLESSKVPETVKESQQKAGEKPEASAVPEEVREKAQVEEELKDTVPKAPATSEGTAGVGTEKKENTGVIAGTAAATGGAAVAAAMAATSKFSENATPAFTDAKNAAADTANKNLPDSVKDKLPAGIQSAVADSQKNSGFDKVSPEVPKEVKESIAESGKGPEAAASTAAVEDKKHMESELLKDVKRAPAVDDSAKATDAAKSEAANTKPTDPAAAVAAAPAANGSEAKPAAATTAAANGTESKTTGAGATAAKDSKDSKDVKSSDAAQQKKKGRLSTFIGKLKEKLK